MSRFGAVARARELADRADAVGYETEKTLRAVQRTAGAIEVVALIVGSAILACAIEYIRTSR